MPRMEIELEADPKRINNLMKKKSVLLASLEYFYEKIKQETGKTPSLEEINKEHKKSNERRKQTRK